MSAVMESLERRYEAIKPHLSERQRRIWLGSEARELGSGGVPGGRTDAVQGPARPTGAARTCGLDDPEPAAGPLRAPAVGAKPRNTTRRCRWRWTTWWSRSRGAIRCPRCGGRRSRRGPGRELRRQGHRVSATRWAAAARGAGYSLQANSKTREGAQHPDRDAQFRHINDPGRGAPGRREPVISVDTKKKELVGEFKNGRQRVATRRATRSRSGPRLPRPRGWARRSPTASTTWPPTRAGSASASTTTPPRSRSRRIRRWWHSGPARATPTPTGC